MMEDVSAMDTLPIDKDDPLYDEAEDTKYILSSTNQQSQKNGYDPGTARPVYGPLLTKSEFKIQVAICVQEYFDSCDADEVIRTLTEQKCKEYHTEIVKKAISVASDKGPRERELVSRLLTCLHPALMSTEELEVGFEILLDSMDELSKDVPDASVS